MSCFCAFDLGKLPNGCENNMAKYDNQNINDIVSHYKSALHVLAADCGYLSEWPKLKVTLAERKTQRKIDPLAVNSDLLRKYSAPG